MVHVENLTSFSSDIQMRTLRHGEGKGLAQGHSRGQGQPAVVPRALRPRPNLLVPPSRAWKGLSTAKGPATMGREGLPLPESGSAGRLSRWNDSLSLLWSGGASQSRPRLSAGR